MSGISLWLPVEAISKHRDREEVVIEVVITMQLAMTEVEVCSRLQYRMYKYWKVYNSTDCWSPAGPHRSLVPGSPVLRSTVYTNPKKIDWAACQWSIVIPIQRGPIVVSCLGDLGLQWEIVLDTQVI